MSFFFDRNQNRKKRDTVSKETLHKLECAACPLDKARVNSPKMPPSGSDKPLVYILGEAPGKTEDQQGIQFVGESGAVLRNELPAEFEKKIRFNNVIRTRPPSNRTPEYQEIESCRPSIVRDIEATKPKAIFGFGNVPLTWATNQSRITVWRGRRMCVKIGSHVCWFYPFLHPSYLIREANSSHFGREKDPLSTPNGKIFRLDLKRAIAEVELIDPPNYYGDRIFDGIEIFTGGPGQLQEVIKVLYEISRSKGVAVGVDIETNGLKPYARGAKILSIAIGNDDYTVSIALDHKDANWNAKEKEKLKDAIYYFLTSSECIKVAHNLTFELEWFAWFFGADVIRDSHMEDTMAQAYTLNEHKALLSLDSLCIQYFGFSLKGASRLNIRNLDDEPLEKVLLYNGGDAKFTGMLYVEQDRRIRKNKLMVIYDEQIRRIPTMVHTQRVGLEVDNGLAIEYQRKLADEIKEIKDYIRSDLAVVDYEKEHGEFNPSSPAQVIELLRDYKKRSEVVVGQDGNGNDKYSSDKNVLEEIGDDFCLDLLKMRTLEKLKASYVDTVVFGEGENIWPDGKIHTNMNTMFTDTGRLSSDNPNIQNWPKRSDKWVRKLIMAPKGYWLVSFDYGQIEPRVLAMASQDKTWIDMLWGRYDIHMEWAKELAHAYPSKIGGKRFIDDKDAMKALRYETKSNFVLAGIYGAQPPSISRNMNIPQNIIERIQAKFWKTFSGMKNWQESNKKFYNKHGYVECLTGRRRHGPLSVNKMHNTPIQGTASDVVVDSMNRLSEKADEESKWQYQAVMNIHDDLSFYLPDKTLEDDVRFIVNSMIDVPYKFAKGVPIQVDVEYGFNWYEMTDVGQFFTDERP